MFIRVVRISDNEFGIQDNLIKVNDFDGEKDYEE